MARPAARASGAAAVAVLLTLQLLLLLPAPASSSFLVPAIKAIARSTFIKQAERNLVKKKATSGGVDLIVGPFGTAVTNDEDQLGRAAADNAGFVVLNVTVGTAAFSGVLDIFEDFAWVRCPPANKSFQKKVPCTNPTCLSTLNITAADCPKETKECSYVYTYGPEEEGTNSTGYLANATFAVGEGIAGSVVFGCSEESTVLLDGQSGVFGFSKGNLSLVSQLNISRFSYFLAPDDSNSSESTSVVLLGEDAVPQTKHSRSTPLVRNKADPDTYYVNLTGIQVDGEPLTGIPPGALDLADDGSGGVVLSTIDPLTFLQADVYYKFKEKLVSKISPDPISGSPLAEVFDLCYNMTSVADLMFPKVTLLFDGEDSPTMELTTVNYFYKDNETGLQCLTMLPNELGATYPSVLGSMLQAGTNMIYDIGAGQLTFDKGEKGAAPAPVPSQVSLMVMIASLLLAWMHLFF